MISDHKPFSPAKSPIYYGWIVLLCSGVGILMSFPGQTVGVAVFTDSLMNVLDLSRSQLSTAYMFGTIASSLCLARAGRVYDKLGARRMAPWVACLLGLTLALLSLVDKFVALVANFLGANLHVPIAFVTIMFGFLALRFLGQGVLTMVSRNMAMKWFRKKRGLANGLLAMAVSFGLSVSVVGLNQLVEELTWRGAWVFLGVVVGVIFMLFAALFYRDDPRSSGLVPDGKLLESSVPQQFEERQHTLQEAKQSYLFWSFNLGLAFVALLHTAISFHIVSIFELAGFLRAEAVGIFMQIAVVATIGSLLGGWLSDRFHLKYFLMLLMIGCMLTCSGLVTLDSLYGKSLVIVGMGISQGMFSILAAVTWPRYFGTAHLGAISGYNMSWIVFFSALGPALFGLSYDVFSGYHGATWLCMIVAGLLLLQAVLLRESK